MTVFRALYFDVIFLCILNACAGMDTNINNNNNINDNNNNGDDNPINNDNNNNTMEISDNKHLSPNNNDPVTTTNEAENNFELNLNKTNNDNNAVGSSGTNNDNNADNNNAIKNDDNNDMVPVPTPKRKRPAKERNVIYQHVEKNNFFKAVQYASGGPWKYANMKKHQKLLAQPELAITMPEMAPSGSKLAITMPGMASSESRLYHGLATFLREAKAIPASRPIPSNWPEPALAFPMPTAKQTEQMPNSSIHGEPSFASASKMAEPSLEEAFFIANHPSVPDEMPTFADEEALGRYRGTLESLVWPISPQNKQQIMGRGDEQQHHWWDSTAPNYDALLGAPSVSAHFNPADYLYTFNEIGLTNGGAVVGGDDDDDVQTVQDRLRNAALQAIENSVKQVRQGVDVSLFCLGILPSSIDDLLEQIRQDHHPQPEGTFNETILQNLEPENAINCLKKWFFEDEQVKENKSLKAKVADIQAQTRALFGQDMDLSFLFESAGDASSSNEKLKEKQVENSDDEKRTIVLFFYIRLYRKLAGLLEAPLKRNERNDNTEKCERVALLHWIVVSGTQITSEFVKHLKSNNQPPQNVQKKIKFAHYFNVLDNIKESMGLVQLLIEATVLPIVGQQHFQLDTSKLLILLQQIQSENIGCLILNRVWLSMAQIVNISNNLFQKTFGATNNFLTIFVDAIRAEHAENGGQRRPNAIQNAKIYLKIYKIASNYLTPGNRAQISSFKHLAHAWDQVQHFLDQSIRQLEALIRQWDVAKAHPFCDDELEKQAINKYINEHCPIGTKL